MHARFVSTVCDLSMLRYPIPSSSRADSASCQSCLVSQSLPADLRRISVGRGFDAEDFLRVGAVKPVDNRHFRPRGANNRLWECFDEFRFGMYVVQQYLEVHRASGDAEPLPASIGQHQGLDMAPRHVANVAQDPRRRHGVFVCLLPRQERVPVRDGYCQISLSCARLTSVKRLWLGGFVDDGAQDVRRADRGEIESGSLVRQGLMRGTGTHDGVSSSMNRHASLSARVLLALYQCIRHASTPSSLTASIDC